MTEKQREYQKKWREANKEEIAVKKKAYYKANKEILAAKKKVYNEANKEKIAASKKAWVESQKDGYYTVYYLKEEHYAGMTTSLKARLKHHKSAYNRHIEDVEIVGRYETIAGALKVEATLHAMGYLGRDPKLNQQTLKQVL